MPLPIDYPNYNITDIRNRLRGGVIEYHKRPIYVLDVRESSIYHNKILKALTLPGFTSFDIEADDPGLNIKGLGRNLGLFNLTEDTPAYISRVPMRSATQSINYNNAFLAVYKNGVPICVGRSDYKNTMMQACNIFDLIPNTPGYVDKGDIYGIKYDFVPFLSSVGFDSMFLGRYPNIYGLLEETRTYNIAISKDYLIERDAFGDVYIADRKERIGKFSINKVRYLENKLYLSGDVERTLGLMPI